MHIPTPAPSAPFPTPRLLASHAGHFQRHATRTGAKIRVLYPGPSMNP